MHRETLTLIVLLVSFNATIAQRMSLDSSEIRFYSYAPLENIEAVNTSTAAIWEPGTGKLVLAIPIREFQFDLSLMQEHFNEKYMESDKYPRAYFKGILKDFDPSLPEQNIDAEGTITIHGIEKPYTLNGKILKRESGFRMETEFKVKLEDHDIEIPQLVWKNIAEVIDISVILNFAPDGR